MCYQRITLALRYQLQALLVAKLTRQEIAKQLGIDRSTISRELSRLTPYDAELAHQDAQEKQAKRHRPRIAEAVWDSLTTSLKAGHSPEQIHGRRQYEGQACPSTETIYRFVYASPDLSQYLRRGRKKRQPRSMRRHPTVLWQSISERPIEANERSEIGHLEADLMEAVRPHTGAVLTKTVVKEKAVWWSSKTAAHGD
ncbi:IS30 family transposase [Deinococcus sp.]|uniref:IS30 family transposase n=1 Tax=Deinococcus sp. TaxID=47478 RepID=UPI003B5CE579